MNLCKTPNQHAASPKIDIKNNNIIVNGYGNYKIKDNKLYTNNNKLNMIKSYLTFENKKVVDLGCANGLYSIYVALYNKKNEITSVDIDKTHLDIVEKISNELNLNIKTNLSNVELFNENVDITIALALIHWIYSCTSYKFGSLDKIIEWLSSFTNEYLLIEWIDAENDINVNFFKHIKYNPEIVIEKYNKENFITALNKYFKNVEHIGMVNKYRELYIAKK